MADASGEASSWRDVTPAQFRLYNLVSTALGVVLLGFGLGLVFLPGLDIHYFPGQVVVGVLLMVVGAVTGLWTAALRIDGTPAPLAMRGDVVRPGVERWAPRVVHFYTRENCTLCHEARTRLAHDLDGTGIAIVDHDVDQDLVLQRRYGDRVPVAVHEGGEVFALGYDAGAVKAVRDRRPGTT